MLGKHSTKRWLAGSAILVIGAGAANAQSAGGDVPSNPAPGQQAGPSGSRTPASSADGHLEDIVVTAQRRSERLQSVPISVSAITSKALASAGVVDAMDLVKVVPGLTFQRTANEGNIFLRGIGSNVYGINAEQSVAIFVDGVYIASPEANMFELNNIERIEVLAGPQGTLFGRNTTGGAIQVITADPQQQFKGNASISYGNYQSVLGTAYVTGGLSDSVSADLAVLYANQGKGFGHNLITGGDIGLQSKNDYQVRSKWLFKLGPTTTAKLTGDYGSTFNNDSYRVIPGQVYLGTHVTRPAGRYDSVSNLQDFQKVTGGGGSLEVDQGIGGLTLVSISAYRNMEPRFTLDQDHGPAPVVGFTADSYSKYFTQELRLSNAGGSALRWTVGGFLYDAKAGYYDTSLTQGTANSKTLSHQNTMSYAAFGQATVKTFAGINLTAGLRYINETQDLIFTAPITRRDSQHFSPVTWRVSLDKQLTRDIMLYASFNRGFKSGGYNLLGPSDAAYKPESLDAYEVGLKSELFDHHLRINGAVYRYDYKDIQSQVPLIGRVLIVNAAAARVTGVEVEADATFGDMTLNAGINYNDAHYTDYPNGPLFNPAGGPAKTADFTGHRLLGTPKWNGTFGATYRINTKIGTFSPNVSLSFRDKYFFYADEALANPGYFLVNAGVTWSSVNDRFSIRGWIKNATDAQYYQRAAVGTLGSFTSDAPPRTYGLTLSTKF